MLNSRCGQIFSSSRAAHCHATRKHGDNSLLDESLWARASNKDLEDSDDGTAVYLIKYNF